MSERSYNILEATLAALKSPKGPVALRFFCAERSKGLGLIRQDPRFGFVLHMRFQGLSQAPRDRKPGGGIGFIPDPLNPPRFAFPCTTCGRDHRSDPSELAALLGAWLKSGLSQKMTFRAGGGENERYAQRKR